MDRRMDTYIANQTKYDGNQRKYDAGYLGRGGGEYYLGLKSKIK